MARPLIRAEEVYAMLIKVELSYYDTDTLEELVPRQDYLAHVPGVVTLLGVYNIPDIGVVVVTHSLKPGSGDGIIGIRSHIANLDEVRELALRYHGKLEEYMLPLNDKGAICTSL